MGIKQVFNPLSGNFDLISTIDDPVEITYAIANNQTNAALGLTFDYTERTYFALVYGVVRSVTGTEIVESGELRGIYHSLSSTWYISNTYTGPGAGITFSIDSSGNVLYTTTNLTGTSYAGTMKLYVEHLIASGSGGEVNTASNLGTGSGLFATKVGADLEFKSLVAGTNVSLSSTATEITIDASASGEVNTASNLGTGSGVYATKIGSDLQFKSLVAGTNVSISSTSNEITINSSEIKPTYTIPVLNVDWSQGYIFYKEINANSTFTFSNELDGKTISLIIRNTSVSTVTITLPTVVKEAGLDLTINASNYNVYTFIKTNTNIYVTAVTQMT